MYGNVVLDRDIAGFLITTAIPTIIANIIGHATNFFGDQLFDAAIGVNLTILLTSFDYNVSHTHFFVSKI